MNWDALGAIGELIGAIAVVATLVYLALQIRFSRIGAADISRHSRANGVRENLLAMSSDPLLRKNWVAASGLKDEYGRLSESLNTDIDGAFQIDFMCQSWMWLHWGQFSSTTTEDDLEELGHLIGMFYSNPPMSICWNESPFEKGMLEPRFVEFVNQAVENHRALKQPDDT
ncbi:MAG: hypothetical protein ACU84Q_13890 [Gammaproteobacteria bacterium]